MYKLALVFVGCAVALLAAGCAGQEGPSPESGMRGSAASPATATPAELQPMDAADKATLIADNFPAEVPVIEGSVLAGKAQGDDAWDYELAVSADAPSTAAWYEQAFTSRSWQTADRKEISRDGGNIIELTMLKGGAQTRVTITPEGEGSHVTVVLGVGAPVLETQ